MNTLPNNFRMGSVCKTCHRWFALGWLGLLFACSSAFALDINLANEAELDSVKGMGPALSAKVLKARAQGAFKDWSDLMQRVSGIRQNKAQQFSDLGLTVNGQAFSVKP